MNIPKWQWPDARGWIGIGVFALSVMLLRMMQSAELRNDEFFQTIATVIISNGLMAVVAWAYASTKGGGELADKNAAIVHESATAAVTTAATLAASVAPAPAAEPQKVEVVNTPDKPAQVEVAAESAGEAVEEELPDYARG